MVPHFGTNQAISSLELRRADGMRRFLDSMTVDESLQHKSIGPRISEGSSSRFSVDESLDRVIIACIVLVMSTIYY